MGLFDSKKVVESPGATAVGEIRAPSAPVAGAGSQRRYGIDRAIQLMRTLPVEENAALVATVIAGTLSSLDMKVSDIIEDATALQKDLQGKIGAIKAKNTSLEKEIERGVDEIVKLEAALAEATSVKERLQLAQSSTPLSALAAAK
jgi:hypothetical protein